MKDLYELFLSRYKGDYAGERPGLGGLSLLYASRRDLSQAEILNLLEKHE